MFIRHFEEYRKYGSYINFIHLRNIRHVDKSLDFYEDDHLEGSLNMVDIIKAIIKEEKKRKRQERKRQKTQKNRYVPPPEPKYGILKMNDAGQLELNTVNTKKYKYGIKKGKKKALKKRKKTYR